MRASLKAEWLKLVTIRAFYGFVIASALLMAFISLGLVAQTPPPWQVTGEQINGLGGTSVITLGLFGLILGMRLFTEEFRHGTIIHTAFSDPRHTRTIVAKATVAGLAGATISVASVLLTGLVMVAMTNVSGGSLDASLLVAPALGLILAGTLWSVLGVAIGALIRQPVPAVVTALLWVLVFENVASFLLGPVARYLPGQTSQVLARGIGEASDVPLAAGVMAAWAAALSVIAWTTIRRRDLL